MTGWINGQCPTIWPTLSLISMCISDVLNKPEMYHAVNPEFKYADEYVNEECSPVEGY